MNTATISVSQLNEISEIRLGDEPSPVAFERFYRQLTDRDDIPTIPEVARHLIVAVNRPTTTTRELAALIGRDQALTAKLLRLSNSPFFNVGPVSNIHRAITLLGFGTVRDLVMTLSLWGAIGDNDPTTRKQRKALWVHCADVAAAAKLLAKKVGRIDPGEALSAGLLHDIGRLLLGLRLGTAYWEMFDDTDEAERNQTAIELEVFGIHHGTVGQYLLQVWALPQTLANAVNSHHEPLESGGKATLSQVVNTANRIVHLMAPEQEDEAGALLATLAPGRLDREAWVAMRGELAEEQAQIAGFFGQS